jgi:MFS family permease
VFGCLAIGLLIAFTVLESRLRNPIMPLRIFRISGLAASSLIRGLLITGMYASFFVGVLYLQHIRHYGSLQTGFAFLPQTLGVAALSFGVTARLVNRFGARPPLLAGLLSCAGGLAVLMTVGAHTSYVAGPLPAFVLIGLGAGLGFMPLLTIAMANVPAADAGMASGIVNTSLQLSGALGVAVLGTVAADRTRALAASGHSASSALLGGYHLAFVVALGCAVAAIAAALVTLRDPARSVSPVSERIQEEALVESEAA